MNASLSASGQRDALRARRILHLRRCWPRLPRQASFPGTLLLFLGVLFLPLLAPETGSYVQRFEARRSRVRESGVRLARSVGIVFDGYLSHVLRLEATVGLAISALPVAGSGEVQRLLAASARHLPGIGGLSWVDGSGLRTLR